MTMQAMKSIKGYYAKRVFKVVKLKSDQQLELGQVALANMQIDLNVSVRNKHFPEIEFINRTIKERIRSVYTELIRVYGRIPGVFLLKLVYAVMLWLNSFPAENGVSITPSPHAMITGQSIEFTKHCLLEFGEYIRTHEDGENSMENWTLEALELCSTRNSQGSH